MKVFAQLPNLEFLHLHNNMISAWTELQSLTGLKKIRHMTLYDNPCVSIPGYRHYIVNSIQSLYALDHFVITDEERIEEASFGYRYRTMNEGLRIYLPEYQKNLTAEKHIFNLEIDMYRLKRIFE
jgi:hypothetical protein